MTADDMGAAIGRIAVPIVAAIAKTSSVSYTEVVSSIPTQSAGRDARANIDELIETTSATMQAVGGARHAKVIVVLSQAEPKLSMRHTLYFLIDGSADHHAIECTISDAVEALNVPVPVCVLKQRVQFETFGAGNPLHVPEIGAFTCTRITVLLEAIAESTGVAV